MTDSRPGRSGKTLSIVAGAAGVVLLLVVGVVIGFVVRDRVGAGASGTPLPAPARYSTAAVTNACDLVDRTPLTKWASTPDDTQTRVSGDSGTLSCGVRYANRPGEGFPMNTASLRVRADVVDGSAERVYAHWTRSAAELVDPGSQVSSGEFTGIGTKGYWQFEADNFGGIVDAEYVMCVWDAGAAVQVRIALSREKAAPAIGRDELDAVARSQARKVLDGLRQNNGESTSAAATSSPVVRSSAAGTTTAQAPAPGDYSMNGVANACDLIDPTPLLRWSATPDRPPVHDERPPSADNSGSLSCQLGYQSQSGDGVHWNQAAIDLHVEFTAPGAAPVYDEWKQKDTAPRPGVNSGELTGLGTQAYWHTAVADSSSTTGTDYVVGAQDSNVSVRVRIPILRQHGEPPVDSAAVGAIARDQAERVLDGLHCHR